LRKTIFKVISARQAAELINDGTMIASTTAGMYGFAEEVAIAIEKCFLETGSPAISPLPTVAAVATILQMA